MDVLVVVVEHADGTLKEQRGPFAVEAGANAIPMDPVLRIDEGEILHLECEDQVPWHIRAPAPMEIATLQVNLMILRGEISDE